VPAPGIRDPPGQASSGAHSFGRHTDTGCLPIPAEYPLNGGRGWANENPPPWHNPLTAAPEPAGPAVGARRGHWPLGRPGADAGRGRACYAGARVSLPPARSGGAPGGTAEGPNGALPEPLWRPPWCPQKWLEQRETGRIRAGAPFPLGTTETFCVCCLLSHSRLVPPQRGRGSANENPPPWHKPFTVAPEPAGAAVREHSGWAVRATRPQTPDAAEGATPQPA
jgi:hypothetical protein